MFPFLVTPCLVVAGQPCMEWIQVKKKTQFPLSGLIIAMSLFLLSFSNILNFLYLLWYISLKSIFQLIAGQFRSQKTVNHVKCSEKFGPSLSGMEFNKPYFNNSSSVVENSNDNKFLTNSLLMKGITLLKVMFLSFFSCVGKNFSSFCVHYYQ